MNIEQRHHRAVEACRVAREVLGYLYVFGAAPTDELARLCNKADKATAAVIKTGGTK